MRTGHEVPVGLVWAQARGGVIGAGGALPWHLPEDLARFKALTTGATVVMGRRTWESLPARSRPLPGRRNLVLTRRAGWSAPGAEVVGSLTEALRAGGDTTGDTNGAVWVIGGGQVYAAALPHADLAVVTDVDLAVDGDTRAPALPVSWRVVEADPATGWHQSASGLRFRTRTWRPRHAAV